MAVSAVKITDPSLSRSINPKPIPKAENTNPQDIADILALMRKGSREHELLTAVFERETARLVIPGYKPQALADLPFKVMVLGAHVVEGEVQRTFYTTMDDICRDVARAHYSKQNSHLDPQAVRRSLGYLRPPEIEDIVEEELRDDLQWGYGIDIIEQSIDNLNKNESFTALLGEARLPNANPPQTSDLAQLINLRANLRQDLVLPIIGKEGVDTYYSTNYTISQGILIQSGAHRGRTHPVWIKEGPAFF